MRVSEVLSGSVEQFLTLTPQMQEHLDEENNPHKVTKAQLGLDNVTNDKQATDADFRSHLSAPVLDHPDGSVTTEKLAIGAVTAERIAKGAIGDEVIRADSITASRLDPSLRSLMTNKVDREEGMGLSQNSFTDAEKAKLGAISVTDEGNLTVDTASLVLKSDPLVLRKTGSQFIKTGEKTFDGEGFVEMCTVTPDPDNGTVYLAGRDTKGIYKVKGIKPDGSTVRYIGTSDTVCHSIYLGKVYLGEMNGDQLTIRTHEGTTFNVWKTITTGCGDSTTLQDFFVLENSIRVVYTSSSSAYGELYIESFTLGGTMQWQVVTQSQKRENYTNSTIYDRRFRMAVMDGEDLYVAPILDQKNKYAVLRINKSGEIVGKFKPISIMAETQILQDIVVANGAIYGFYPGGLYRIDIETGLYKHIRYNGTFSERICGLSAGTNGKLYCLVESKDGTKTTLYMLDGTRTGDYKAQYNPCIEATLELPGTFRLGRLTKDGFEIFRQDGSAFRSDAYQTIDTYAVL